MPDPRKISIKDYTYDLPPEKIALHPLAERDASRLLVFKEGKITERKFNVLADLLPKGALLCFNDTRVLNARLLFRKPTGSIIEVFCLEPSGNESPGKARWKTFIGGISKWREPFLEKKFRISGEEFWIRASLHSKSGETADVDFTWSPPGLTFTGLLKIAGNVPLPPYIKREADVEDSERYQTIYARSEGSVAAPTAGLHFTETVLQNLRDKGMDLASITLHVGAGTFKPVKSETMQGHEMHSEWISADRELLQKLIDGDRPVVAIGTTSLRSLETLFWLGLKIKLGIPTINSLEQWEAFELTDRARDIKPRLCFQAILEQMEERELQSFSAKTSLLIAPGYRFRVADILLTNFHQPKSTLLLLVAAAAGKHWRKIYDYALENDFRFLSYGDANLVFMAES